MYSTLNTVDSSTIVFLPEPCSTMSVECRGSTETAIRSVQITRDAVQAITSIITHYQQFYNQGMVRSGIEDDFSILHSGNFLPFHFHSIPNIFYSIFHFTLIFSFIFHFILPYPGKFRSEVTRNLYNTFATLSVLLQMPHHKGKQYGTMHLTPYLKHSRNDQP